MSSEILADKRPIKSIFQGWGEGESGWYMGEAIYFQPGGERHEVDRIEVYGEPGAAHPQQIVPFYRVIVDDQVYARVGALGFAVVYVLEDDNA